MEQRLLPSLKEIRPHGTEGFPCAVYQTHAVQKGILVKHHWHDEVEILYFFGGNFRLEINMESFPVTGECMFFINPGELHSIFAEKILSSGEDAVVFHPGLLGFDAYDAVQMQLIQPIQNKKLLFPRCLMPEHPAFVPVRDAFAGILHAFGRQLIDESPSENGVVTDDLASQLRIKSSLLSIFALLTAHQLFTPTEKHSDKRVERIKATLAYIKENYKDKIYIRDLAEVVNMNEQYFCRFFKKAIGRSPMEYVSEYRIKQSLHLLEETDLPVMDICLECGYNNLGNFLREFKKQTGTTPLRYRRHFLSAKEALSIPSPSEKS
ncbi:MAG: AraC family transcriptional regulator [Lachnospiraceae bacterium]|nr:AraC family transcriptional regulator [Lachnospiraceae bacterium]